jgi:hypothetical protein
MNKEIDEFKNVLGQRIDQARNEQDLSVNKLCKLAQIERFQYHDVVGNKTNYTFETLLKICVVLDYWEF